MDGVEAIKKLPFFKDTIAPHINRHLWINSAEWLCNSRGRCVCSVSEFLSRRSDHASPHVNLFWGKIMKKLSMLCVILCASVLCAAPFFNSLVAREYAVAVP